MIKYSLAHDPDAEVFGDLERLGGGMAGWSRAGCRWISCGRGRRPATQQVAKVATVG